MTRQGGATLLIVLMIMALATLIATQLVEHSVFSKRRTELMLGRDQAYQLALGGESLARQWLGKGFDKQNDKVHLNQPWATTPFEFPIEGGMIKGTVRDALTCFNLNSLDPKAPEQNSNGDDRNPPNVVEGGGSERRNEPPTPGGGSLGTNQPPDKDQQIYEKLLNELLKEVGDIEVQPQSLVAPVVDWIDDDIQPTGIDGAEDMIYTGYEIPYRTANSLLASKSELRVMQGYSAEVYDAVKDHVCALPDNSINKLNVNTLSEESAPLLAAVLDVDLSTAQEILSNIPEDGYDMPGLQQQVPQQQGDRNNNPDWPRVDVKSDLFLLSIEVEYKGAAFRMKSLVKREGQERDAPFRVVTRYFGEF